MGFFSGLLQAGALLALDTFAAVLNGPKPVKASELKNKSFASDAYGSPFPRCRGTVRLPGKVLWMSPIRTSVRKTVSGGFFGIGSQSVYYNLYSCSLFVGFGKKLGGGPAVKCLRIWADDKLLFNAVVSNAILSGSVTVNGAQLNNSQSLSITLGSGATFKVNAGDLISISGDNTGYEVQIPISATGPATISVPIWPPLVQDTVGGEAVSLPGLNASPYDLSSFDPNPHDGSHISGGYNCPPGGIRFYLGSSTQQPDPEILKIIGTGNSPGYRGICGVHIHDLQLRNYGDHPPQLTAEWAFDTASGQFPQIGPIADMILSHSDETEAIAVPFSGNGAFANFNRLTQAQPYLWVFTQVGEDSTHDGTIHRVNTRTNTLEQSQLVARVGTFRLTTGAMIADNDGYLYYAQNFGAQLTKMDGFNLSVHSTFTGGLSLAGRMYCFDTVQSCFGNNVIIKTLLISGTLSGSAYIFDRTVLLPWGTANPVSTENVVTGYDKSGTPIIAAGDRVGVAGAIGTINNQFPTMTDDASAGVWTVQGSTLQKFDFRMLSWIDFSDPTNPREILLLPSLSRTDIDISAVTAPFATPTPTVHYYPGDDSIIVTSNVGKTGKVDVKTATVLSVVSNGVTGATLSRFVDVMGTLIVSTGSGWARLDGGTLQVSDNYGDFSAWFPMGTGFAFNGGFPAYDELTDAVWIDADNNGGTFGGLNRIFLDRANGQGTGLDSIISSAITELNAKFGLNVQYDVSLVTAAGLAVYGVEFDRESYADSLRKLMELYLIDAPPIDGKIWFIPRGQPSVVAIPESDLGALDDPSKYEPRVVETIQDPQHTPESVWIHYYDPLKQDQPATQYAKRISKPYASSLSSGKNVTNSRQQRDITAPVTENATPMKQQAEKLLWDGWAGRRVCKFKLPPKYERLTPADVLTLTYKSVDMLLRIEQMNIGARGAIEIAARTQDSSVYSGTYLPSSSSGLGGSKPGTTTQPPLLNNNYTINPIYPLHQVSTTDIHLDDVVATFASGLRTFYNNRDFTVPDPGAGNTATYYVTIADPTFSGEAVGTSSLTAFCDLSPATAHYGDYGYIKMGAITIAGTGATGGNPDPGGQPTLSSSGGLIGEVAFGPTAAGDVTGFKVAHNLGLVPSAVIPVRVTGGDVWLQPLRFDAQYIYLIASDSGISGYLEIYA